MLCQENTIHYCSWTFVVGGLLHLLHQITSHIPYGRYVNTKSTAMMVPAKAGWFIQELPSFLVPVLLFLTTDSLPGIGRHLLLWTFCLHYFQRTFVYSLLTKGRQSPLHIVVSAVIFCSVNGFLQGHHMLHCTQYHSGWHRDTRFITGLLMFFTGMAINIHSDYILRNLRKPGEVSYKIPKGQYLIMMSSIMLLYYSVKWIYVRKLIIKNILEFNICHKYMSTYYNKFKIKIEMCIFTII
uniref:Steroid-5-alpha-reductase, alpha polypeptide 2a n=1 Tax=Cyprinus carpio TaxID=7962 RepID=A0A8C2K3H0_CYPCA